MPDPVRPVRPAVQTTPDQAAGPCDALVLVPCVGPHQINRIEGRDEVTVTYPVGSDTVLSPQPDGTWTVVPRDLAGQYERALLKPDRLVFAPLGDQGTAFLVPYTDAIPNV